MDCECFLVAMISVNVVKILLFTIFTTCVAADANIYIVDVSNGSDDNDGLTPETAFKTITKCVEQFTTVGAECHVMEGRYHEAIEITGLRGTEEQPFKIKGYNDHRPIWDGTVLIKPPSWNFDQNSGICSAEIEQDIYALFLNEDLLTAARWPNAKWSDRTVFNNSYWGHSDETSQRDQMVDNGQAGLADSGINATGSMAVLNIGSFNTFCAEVIEHKPGTNNFSYNDTFGDYIFHADHNLYFLEASMELLDAPEEWFYDKETKVLHLIPPIGEECPTGDSLRGRTMDYGLIVRDSIGLTVANMSFFAANVDARSIRYSPYRKRADVNYITLENVNMLFGASSHRMLKSPSVPKWTRMNAHTNNGKMSVINCTFIGSEGAALNYGGGNNYIHNNLFAWNDWTGHLMSMGTGGSGTVTASTTSEEFSQNTLWYNGASAGVRPGSNGNTSFNHVVGQCWGKIQNDGSGMQFQKASQEGAYINHNWVHDSPKSAIRFDSNGRTIGYNGNVLFNVAWNTGSILIKGDNHTVLNNLALDRKPDGSETDINSPTLVVIYKLRLYPLINNNNTIVLNNGASRADGGKDKHTGGRYPVAGKVVENNYSGRNVRENLYDPVNWDFRPLTNSNFTDGEIIGPYLPDVQDFYWIPGYKYYKTATPIPPTGSTVRASRDILMFLGAYRADFYHWFFGTDKTTVENAEITDEEYYGQIPEGKNVLKLPHLDPNKDYFWRVDTQWGGYLYKGDVWNFHTSETSKN